jgi:hypothetical protein
MALPSIQSLRAGVTGFGIGPGMGFGASLGFRVCGMKIFTWRKQRRNDADDLRWSPGGRRGREHLHASKPS